MLQPLCTATLDSESHNIILNFILAVSFKKMSILICSVFYVFVRCCCQGVHPAATMWTVNINRCCSSVVIRVLCVLPTPVHPAATMWTVNINRCCSSAVIRVLSVPTPVRPAATMWTVNINRFFSSVVVRLLCGPTPVHLAVTMWTVNINRSCFPIIRVLCVPTPVHLAATMWTVSGGATATTAQSATMSTETATAYPAFRGPRYRDVYQCYGPRMIYSGSSYEFLEFRIRILPTHVI